jgi:hypothetical protein
MKRIFISLTAFGLIACQGVAWADAAANAETCIECHDLEEFQGMDAAALAAGVEKGNADNKMMAKSIKDMSPEDLQGVVDYLAAEANK